MKNYRKKIQENGPGNPSASKEKYVMFSRHLNRYKVDKQKKSRSASCCRGAEANWNPFIREMNKKLSKARQ